MGRLAKLIKILGRADYVAALGQGVAAAVEHEPVLAALGCATVVDIGANRGQFALVAERCFPSARIVSFEPLPGPARKYRLLFGGRENIRLHQSAIGPQAGTVTMHVSRRDDSSSLLPITALQDSLFPGTAERSTEMVPVAPLDTFVSADSILSPALLKLDVQGYELQALRGCEPLLERFEFVYAECSFVELYAGQALAHEVIAYLQERGFRLCGVYSLTYDRAGQAVQGDFFFKRAAVVSQR